MSRQNSNRKQAKPTAHEQAVTPYQIVTDKIVALLETGVIPWKASWKRPAGHGPKSLVTRKPYRGINHILLDVIAHVQGYASPYWLTFHQALALGGHVRKGEKGSPCFFWKIYGGEHETADETSAAEDTTKSKRFVARYYTVFSLDQCDGIASPEEPQPLPDFTPIAECERIVAGYHGPTLDHGDFDPCYIPPSDRVCMPSPTSFASPETYYATLFHELGHSTGHSTRLARFAKDSSASFGSVDYSKEELVAELTAAFLCAETGISPANLNDQAAYVAGWLAALKNDSRLIVTAAAQAEKAADLILGRAEPSPSC